VFERRLQHSKLFENRPIVCARAYVRVCERALDLTVLANVDAAIASCMHCVRVSNMHNVHIEANYVLRHA
jgi:hypothetical protein